MELQCVFLDFPWYLGDARKDRYTCKIDKILITEPGTEITSFVGKHLLNRTNNDVTGIFFKTSIVHYFPKNLHKVFPNLNALSIDNCGLKEISREDLIGLEKLEDICLPQNKLRSLPHDLFEGMVNLKEITFNENKLEFLRSKLLDPIAVNGIIRLDFRGNTKIDAFYQPGKIKSVGSLQELMKIIDKNCEPPKDEREDFAQGFVVGFKELWTSKDFSDFTIIGGFTGSPKEFAVHKNVLGTQSSVMLATLKNDLKEAQTGKMEIDDFSAEAVEAMLKFMYTGKIEDESIAMDLHAIAQKYDVELLKQRTEKIILHNLTEDNALDIFGFAHLHNSDKIKRAAFEVIKKMFPDTKLSDALMNQPEALKKLIEARHKFLEHEHEYQQALKKFKAE
jgi:BTB/POZ domain